MLRLLVLPVLLLLVLVPIASAEPGEPPIQLLSPADGGRVAPDLDGVPVSFTCPATAAEPPFGSATAYGVELARSTTLGASGRLAESIGTGLVVPRGDGSGICDARLGGGSAPRPQVTPGTYSWQAWRYCDGCSTGFETSPVESFTIGLGGTVRLSAPKRAWAGYPVAFGVTNQASATTSTEGVQRSVGGKWVTVSTRRGEAFLAALPRGRQRLRAFVGGGGQTLVSEPRTVTVSRARRWSTSRRDVGVYADPQRPSVRARVVDGGRRIAGVHADITVDCVDLGAPGGIAVANRVVDLPTVRVAPDGRFAVYLKVRSIEVTFIGRLGKRRLRADVLRYADGGCAGSIKIDARRR